MLHHLKKVTRRMLALFGTLVLLWTPISYLVYAGGEAPLPHVVGAKFSISCVSGVAALTVFLRVPPWESFGFSYDCSRVSTLKDILPPSLATDMMLHPKMFQCLRYAAPDGRFAVVVVAVPLLVIALALLLWPALSFGKSYYWRRRSITAVARTPVST